jgi:hypothetical protein
MSFVTNSRIIRGNSGSPVIDHEGRDLRQQYPLAGRQLRLPFIEPGFKQCSPGSRYKSSRLTGSAAHGNGFKTGMASESIFASSIHPGDDNTC